MTQRPTWRHHPSGRHPARTGGWCPSHRSGRQWRTGSQKQRTESLRNVDVRPGSFAGDFQVSFPKWGGRRYPSTVWSLLRGWNIADSTWGKSTTESLIDCFHLQVLVLNLVGDDFYKNEFNFSLSCYQLDRADFTQTRK